MSDYKPSKTANLYPTVNLGIYGYYDHERIISHFLISTSESGKAFFNRHFIKIMCEALNQNTNQDYLRGLQMDVHFDKVDGVIVCRFDLPINAALKKAAMVFLFDMISYGDKLTWIEKVIFDRNYFVVFANSIN